MIGGDCSEDGKGQTGIPPECLLTKKKKKRKLHAITALRGRTDMREYTITNEAEYPPKELVPRTEPEPMPQPPRTS